jgi:hypothetical protein
MYPFQSPVVLLLSCGRIAGVLRDRIEPGLLEACGQGRLPADNSEPIRVRPLFGALRLAHASLAQRQASPAALLPAALPAIMASYCTVGAAEAIGAGPGLSPVLDVLRATNDGAGLLQHFLAELSGVCGQGTVGATGQIVAGGRPGSECGSSERAVAGAIAALTAVVGDAGLRAAVVESEAAVTEAITSVTGMAERLPGGRAGLASDCRRLQEARRDAYGQSCKPAVGGVVAS